MLLPLIQLRSQKGRKWDPQSILLGGKSIKNIKLKVYNKKSNKKSRRKNMFTLFRRFQEKQRENFEARN